MEAFEPAPVEPTRAAEPAPTDPVRPTEPAQRAADADDEVSATEPTVETPLVDVPVEAYLFDTPGTAAPAAKAAETDTSRPEPTASPAPAEAAAEQPEAEQAAEPAPEAPVRRTKRKGRASVPSWDEIMFGGGPTK